MHVHTGCAVNTQRHLIHRKLHRLEARPKHILLFLGHVQNVLIKHIVPINFKLQLELDNKQHWESRHCRQMVRHQCYTGLSFRCRCSKRRCSPNSHLTKISPESDGKVHVLAGTTTPVTEAICSSCLDVGCVSSTKA